MDQSLSLAAPLRSALFVDFDNIYIGLSKTDPLAAERFASDPSRWLAWLEKGLPAREGSEPRPRSILIRRCYPNPDAGFRRFRSFFTSAAFSVIDCPSMTRMGKNSADIYMVMDILDFLNHKTHFDEFLILSGDSDFMPVLLRLRAYDRRTTTLAIDFMPPAFKAACDLVISEEEFIEEALGITQEGSCSGLARSRVPMPLLKLMAARVYELACAEGEVAGANLPDILKDFREFRDSTNWLGFGTSQRLAEAFACCEPRLNIVRLNPMMYKLVIQQSMPAKVLAPSRHTRSGEKLAPVTKLFANPDSAPVVNQVVQKAGNAGQDVERPGQAERPSRSGERAASGKPGKAELNRLRGQVIAIVKELVAGSSNAVLLARASQYVVNKIGPQVLDTQWAGAGSFKRLLQGTSDLGLEITTQPEPGYVFDPLRHENPGQRGKAVVQEEAALPENGKPEGGEGGAEGRAEPPTEEETPYMLGEMEEPYEDDEEAEEEGEDYQETLPSLEEFARRVSQVTGAPDLTSRQYAMIFNGIVNELQEIAEGQKAYNTYQSSKAVSDWCASQGEPVSRADVVSIFKGIIFQDGVRFGKRPGSYTAHELASVVCGNIKALCRRSRLELSEYEEHLLDEWIVSGLDENQAQISEAARETEEDPRG